MLDGAKVKITHHAICRYAERFGGDEESMRAQLSRAVTFGAQRGGDRIYLDKDAAFVLDRYGVIKTALTKSMLMANMQLAFRGLKQCEPVSPPPKTEDVDLQFIASLAAEHCKACFPHCFGKSCRKTRNRLLRENGIDPQGEEVKVYHEMFLKAYQERLAEESSNDPAAKNQDTEKRPAR
jgi:hypothetical protein